MFEDDVLNQNENDFHISPKLKEKEIKIKK